MGSTGGYEVDIIILINYITSYVSTFLVIRSRGQAGSGEYRPLVC